MQIEKLYLNNFRNIKDLNISFAKHINIFYGLNGQGKTNIVEAIYFLTKSQSFRTNYTKELINVDSKSSTVEGTFYFNKYKQNQKLVLVDEKKACYIENKVVRKASDYLGNSNAICFCPEDVIIFKDSPSARRKMLDFELSSLFPNYIKQLILCKKYLEERNDLLKQDNIDKFLLEVLDDKLVESSYDVFIKRKWLIGKLNIKVNDIYNKLIDNNHEIKIEYKTFLNEDNKDKYLFESKRILTENIQKDILRKYSNIGIHKDDFIVYLDNKDVSIYASQGQCRLLALVIKLAIFEIVKELNKEEPILILDDAFSELDDKKKKALYSFIETKQQVFITCTDYKEVTNKNVTLYKIENGNVKERNVI